MVNLLEECKHALRLDGDEEDVFIESLIESSKIVVQQATGQEVDENNHFHRLIVRVLVVQFHMNPELLKVGSSVDDLSFSVGHLLQQMKYCPPEQEGEPP
jgi:uncharacterized phage protein (predicted DNA packaging)